MLLSALVFLPLIYALVVLVLPRESWIRPVSLALSLLHFALSCSLFYRFDPHKATLQLVEKFPWIPTFGVNYFLAIDGISFWLVLMSVFFTPLVILGSWKGIEKRLKSFHVCLFLLLTSMVGTFLAMDAVLFYVFFEASLIPMYFLVGVWGGPRRLYATMKFFIYTMTGSLFMLVAIVALIFMTQEQLGALSASIPDFYHLQIPFVANTLLSSQTLLFFAFAFAFAIKVPMFPFHTWLPDAHVEAPTPGSVILAAIMLKMGTYGFMRIVLPTFPDAVSYWGWLFMLLGVIGIIYGALVAMVQPDLKKLVAYSSVSHMGYVMLGIFALNIYGVTGGLYQMLNHGVSTGALFLLIGMIYEKTHSRQIADYGGLAKAAPIFTIAFLLVTFSSIAVPLTNGFVGEFLILLGSFQANPIFAIFAVTGVILGAVYMLWAVKRIFFGGAGKLIHQHSQHNLDLGAREVFVLAPLILFIFWMGVFPNDFLSWSEASLTHFVQDRGHYELTVEEPEQRIGKRTER